MSTPDEGGRTTPDRAADDLYRGVIPLPDDLYGLAVPLPSVLGLTSPLTAAVSGAVSGLTLPLTAALSRAGVRVEGPSVNTEASTTRGEAAGAVIPLRTAEEVARRDALRDRVEADLRKRHKARV